MNAKQNFGSHADECTEVTPLLEVKDLKKHFAQSSGFFERIFGGGQTVKAVDGVSFDLYPGETMAIVGESGCGKSTLGETILNLHEATEGEVRFQGEKISGLSDAEMRPYRKNIQMIYQDPLASLNPRQSVEDILLAPMEVHDVLDSRDQRVDRAKELLERVGLGSEYLSRYPHEFSGGQQQRVGIARALTLEPDLLIADEPTSALDVSIQAQIVNLLQDLQDELGLSIVFITHNLAAVQYIADRVGVMYLGEIVETAPIETLFMSPGHPYTVSLLSAIPRIRNEARTERVVLRGSVPSPSNPPCGCRFHTRCPVVVPPESWEATHDLFLDGFRYYKAVKQREFDLEDIKVRLKLEDKANDSNHIADYICRQYIEDFSLYPEEIADTIVKSANAVANGNSEEAIDLLEPLFESPCETSVPNPTALKRDHEVKCHRINPSYESDPIHRKE